MEITDNTERIKHRLIDAIVPLILKNGLKATTMDYVASSLSMSKRTLYEVFDNKNDMLKEAIECIHQRHLSQTIRIFEKSGTVMEALYRILRATQASMREVSVEFFRDMDTYCKDLRSSYDQQAHGWNEGMMKVFRIGVEQGVFREKVNYPVMLRVFRIQMESLKRMEEFFPEDVSLPEVFDAIAIGFLRSIASQKGIMILEEIQDMDFPEEYPYFLTD